MSKIENLPIPIWLHGYSRMLCMCNRRRGFGSDSAVRIRSKEYRRWFKDAVVMLTFYLIRLDTKHQRYVTRNSEETQHIPITCRSHACLGTVCLCFHVRKFLSALKRLLITHQTAKNSVVDVCDLHVTVLPRTRPSGFPFKANMLHSCFGWTCKALFQL